MMRLVPCGLLVCLVVAGCAGPPGSGLEAGSGPSNPAAPTHGPVAVMPGSGKTKAPESPEFGAISGLVIDEQGLPVSDAAVGLAGFDVEARSSSNGSFFFDRLEPGTYRVVVQAIGYENNGKTLGVAAGEVAELRLILIARAQASAPHYFAQTADGFIGCNLVTPVVTSSTDYCSDPNTRLHHFFNLTSETTATVTEFVWSTSGPLQSAQMSVTVHWQNQVNNQWVTMKSNQSAGPSVIRVVRDDYANVTEVARVSTGLLPRATSADNPVVFVYQQRFTIWMTGFYLGHPIPEGYSAIPK